MEDEELPPGALSQAVEGEPVEPVEPGVSAPFTVREALSTIRADQARVRREWDNYAKAIRDARVGPDPLTRLSRALRAYGAPSTNPSRWVALNKGLEEWQRSGAEVEAAERQKNLDLAKMGLQRETELADLSSKYAAQLAKGRQGASNGYLVQTQNINGEPYTIYSPKDPSLGLQAFAEAPGGKRIPLGPQGTLPGAGRPGAAISPAQAGAATAGGRPSSGPITQDQFLALPVEQRMGVEFIDATGATKRGTATGGVVEVAPAEPRPANRDEAMSFGFFSGQFKNGEFVPSSTDESNRVPDISAIDSDIDKIGANVTHMRGLQRALRNVLPLINNTTVGFGGWLGSFVPGSPAYELKSEIDKYIGGNIGFDRLQDMRVNSPTGGALGQVAVQELEALKASAGNLDPKQGPERLRRGVQDVLAKYEAYVAAAEKQIAARQRIKSDVTRVRGLGSQAPAGTGQKPSTSNW